MFRIIHGSRYYKLENEIKCRQLEGFFLTHTWLPQNQCQIHKSCYSVACVYYFTVQTCAFVHIVHRPWAKRNRTIDKICNQANDCKQKYCAQYLCIFKLIRCVFYVHIDIESLHIFPSTTELTFSPMDKWPPLRLWFEYKWIFNCDICHWQF